MLGHLINLSYFKKVEFSSNIIKKRMFIYSKFLIFSTDCLQVLKGDRFLDYLKLLFLMLYKNISILENNDEKLNFDVNFLFFTGSLRLVFS